MKGKFKGRDFSLRYTKNLCSSFFNVEFEISSEGVARIDHLRAITKSFNWKIDKLSLSRFFEIKFNEIWKK